MPQLVHERSVNFLPKVFLVAFGLIPDVLQEKHDLWRQRPRCRFLFGEFRPDEQPERIRLNSIATLSGVGPSLESDWQRLRSFPERRCR